MRRILVVALSVVALLSLVRLALPGSAAAAPSETVFLPAISRGGSPTSAPGEAGPLVQLAWFNKPPTNGDLTTLSQRFQGFILTKNDEPVRDSLRQNGVRNPILRYVRLDAIMDPGSCSAQPYRNQVADRVGDFCQIRDQHPDWFLRDSSGQPIIDREGRHSYYIMDPGNAGWRAFWLERVSADQIALGWDGVSLDNVEASLRKRIRLGAAPAGYPTEESYQAAVEGFLAYIYSGYFKPSGQLLQGNIIEIDEIDVWFRYLDHLDGAMREGWGVDWSDGYRSVRDWNEHLALVEGTEAQGKRSILVALGAQGDTNRQQFVFASYLLVSNGHTFFRYTDDEAYNDIWLYDNYDLDLGAPLGARYQSGSSWVRDFENGRVTVDPAAHTSSITLN